MMRYADIEIPPRSDHLWRYTPWKRIHPTSVDDVPESLSASIAHDKVATLDSSNEIARAFIHEVASECPLIEVDNQNLELDLRCSGHISSTELKVKASGDSTLIIRISGDAGWAGIRIQGEVDGNFAFAIINDLSADSHLLRCEDWVVNRDSTLEFATLSSGGFLVKSDIRVDLTATGSSVSGGIASHGTASRHDDHHIEITHSKGHTDSSLVMHAACTDSSHSVGTGLLTIAEGADGSDAGQVFRNLLLSEKARAEAIPELEVLAEDVKAAHGAASAPIDLGQLHYLASRGLSPDQASSMIVEGFLMDAFKEIKNQKVIDVLRTRLLVHLECLIKG